MWFRLSEISGPRVVVPRTRLQKCVGVIGIQGLGFKPQTLNPKGIWGLGFKPQALKGIWGVGFRE